MRKPPHTIIHHNQLWARMYVPTDVQDVIGTKLFLQKIGEWPMPLSLATAVSASVVASWKKLVEDARQQPTGIDVLLKGKEQTAHDVIEHLIALCTELGQEAAATQLRGIAFDPLTMARSSRTEKAASNVSPAQADIPLLHHFEEWKKKTHLGGKTLDQAASDIRQFSASVSRTLGTLTGADVQAWIEESLERASASTVRRKLSAVRSYWTWLESHERVAPDRNPFAGRRVMDQRTRVQRKLEQRQRFEPEEIMRLIEAAKADAPLCALIRLAAYTGARREGVASLGINSVVTVQGVQCFRFTEKSEAGVRTVPVHSEILDLTVQLIRTSSDGFLIPSEQDKYGRRGDALGKRFSKLKTRMGYGPHHTFHSIRHTVVHLFRSVGCPVEIRNIILGHEDGDGETGAGAGYGGDISPQLKLEWIERAIRYPASL